MDPARRPRPIERPLRLFTGLLLFTFATSHFLAHASGLLQLPAMEAARTVLLWPWRTPPGEALLVASVLTHGGLGLWALYRRRHLRMPAAEAWQLGLGLCIPILLISHGMAGLFSDELTGTQLTYTRALYLYWMVSPDLLLPRQITLLLILWLHGCIGVRGWLLVKPWYRRWAPVLGALALSLPVLALAGIFNGAWDVERRVATEPAVAVVANPPPGGEGEAAGRAMLAQVSGWLVDGYVLLLVGTIGLRQLRNWHARRANPVRVTYPGGRVLVVPRGTSVLEASRAAGIAHMALCGGRGRCSTCRVRVSAGSAALPPPNPTEAAVLERMKAPPSVRLACQLRPTADLTVAPLLTPRDGAAMAPVSIDDEPASGRELPITALFIDLRGSTTLAAARLPYDALFIVGRYLQVVGDVVRRHGGYVTAIAGDGVMGMFADEADPAAAAARALHAADTLWRAIEDLSAELAEELEAPLGFGIGLHTGVAVVGPTGCGTSGSIQFIGDPGNVAARLEDLTKDLGATVILSDKVAVLAGCRDLDRLERREVAIRGREGTLAVRLVHRRSDLAATLAGV